MTAIVAGGVDCDLHPAVPHLTSLLPYLDDYWRDQVTTRGMVDLVSQSYPANSPISARPDWRPAQGKPGSRLEDMQAQALDPFEVAYGICNPLYVIDLPDGGGKVPLGACHAEAAGEGAWSVRGLDGRARAYTEVIEVKP